MPLRDDIAQYKDINHLIRDELNYDCAKLAADHKRMLSTITVEQKHIYDTIMDAVNADAGGIFFVYGYGGTGKTFLRNVLRAGIRSKGQIVLNVASSGIAALLLQGGRTAHSRFGIPMVVNDYTLCSISAGSHQAELLEHASLIIWDEAPMMSRHCFETLDRTMRDILKCKKVFGGKVVVLGADFRQILPVIVGGTKVETVMASLNSSPLWFECKVMELKTNMRLLRGSGGAEDQEMADFAKWILDIGNGKISEPNTGEVEIDIPSDLLITDEGDHIENIVAEVYGRSYATTCDPKFYRERAILSLRNEDVDIINEFMLSKLACNY